jgi:hypothetical protein
LTPAGGLVSSSLYLLSELLVDLSVDLPMDSIPNLLRKLPPQLLVDLKHNLLIDLTMGLVRSAD